MDINSVTNNGLFSNPSIPDGQNNATEASLDQAEVLLAELQHLPDEDEVVGSFIRKHRASIEEGKTFARGNTFLHEASKNGKTKLLEKLINGWDGYKPNLNEKNDEGDTPIISILKICFDEESRPAAFKGTRSWEEDLYGDLKTCLKILVNNGANVEEKNKKGLTAIGYASLPGTNLVYFDILFKGRKDSIGSKMNSLHYAIKIKDDLMFSNRLKQFRLDSKYICWLMYYDNGIKYTLLQAVCKYGMLESAKYLIFWDKKQLWFTPLENHRPIQLSCLYAKPRILEYLLDLNNGNHLNGEKTLRTKHGRNLLHLAVKKSTDYESSHECLKILLEIQNEIGSLNEQDDYGRTPLHYAAIRKNDTCVEELMRNGANYEIRDKVRKTPLAYSPKLMQMAIQSLVDENEVIEKFITMHKEGIKEGKIFSGGNTFLHEAGINGKSKLLQKLINGWEDYQPDVNEKNDEGDTPIISILKKCSLNDKNCISGRRIYQKIECQKHLECLKILVGREATVEATTAIRYASICIDKKSGYLSKLLGNAAIENTIVTLYEAIKTENDHLCLEQLRILHLNLYDKTRWLIYKDNGKKYTLFQAICKYGMLESAKYLISLDDNQLWFTPLENHCPIQLSCLYAKPRILEYLLDLDNGNHLNGEEPLRTKQGRNLLHLAVKKSRDYESSHECLKILLEIQNEIGSLNEQDDYGRTPLHYAAISNNDICVKELLRNGAHYEIEDRFRNTPLAHISKPAMQEFLDSLITMKIIKSRHEMTNNSVEQESLGSLSVEEVNESTSLLSADNRGESERPVGFRSSREILVGLTENRQGTSGSLNATPKETRIQLDEDDESSNIAKNEKKSSTNADRSIKQRKIDDSQEKPREEKSKTKITKMLVFNLNPFIRKSNKKATGEEKTEKEYLLIPTNLLYQIKKNKHLEELLGHPIFSLILQYKWIKVWYYYYYYLTFYLSFCSFYAGHVFISEYDPQKKITVKSHEQNSTLISNDSSATKNEEPLFLRVYRPIILYASITIFLLIELDIATEKKRHREKWSLLCLNYSYLYMFCRRLIYRLVLPLPFLLPLIVLIEQNCGPISFCRQLKVLSILLVFFKLFNTLGKNPHLTIHIRSFYSAAWSLIWFTVTHSVLIIAFALSFHVLLQYAVTKSENPFQNFGEAIFKTLIMLAGEFEASGTIPFNESPVFSRIIFTVFIFTMIFVILNLLSNFLQPMKAMEYDPYLRKCLAKMYIITRYERHFEQSRLRLLQKSFQLCSICLKKTTIYKHLKENIYIAKEDFVIVWDDEKKTFDNSTFFSVFDYIQRKLLIMDRDVPSRLIPQAWEIVTKRFSKN